MHQLEEAAIWPHLPQGFNQAKANSTAAMNSKPCGLVDDQQAVTFVQNGLFQMICQPLPDRRSLATLRCSDRWYAYHITRFQPSVGLYSFLVNTDLALAKNPVNHTLGHTF